MSVAHGVRRFAIKHLPPVCFTVLVLGVVELWTGEPHSLPTVIASCVALSGVRLWFDIVEQIET